MIQSDIVINYSYELTEFNLEDINIVPLSGSDETVPVGGWELEKLVIIFPNNKF